MKYIDKSKRYGKEDYIITGMIRKIFHKNPNFFLKPFFGNYMNQFFSLLNGLSFQLEYLIFKNISHYHGIDLKMIKNEL